MSRLLLLAFCLCCIATTAFAQDVIVINEAVYDSPGTDVACWAELKGTPGMSLNGYKLVGVNGNGGAEYNPILLDGFTVPADGYFLITQDPANPPGSDLVSTNVNFQNGPDNILLQRNVGGVYQVVDAVGYGTFGTSDTFAGEGSPCLGQGGNANASMARCPDGRDTQNNSADFIVDVLPTPGAPNAGSCAPVTGACCFQDGSCQVLTQNSCTSQSGTYQGDNVPCDPNPCSVVLPTDLTLCQVSEDNADGTPFYGGQWVHVHGICTLESNTWAPNRIEFTITDGECCTNVFNGGAASPVIHVGDEVDVIGTVGQFNGKTQVTTPNLTITVVSSGNPIPTPGLVTTGDFAVNGENYESCLIEIRCVSIVSGTWPPANTDATIVVDDGTGPCDLRIDRDTNIDGSTPPTGPFTIIGIASQFDSSNPYTSGYQIMPRSIDDLLFNDCAPPLGACCFPSGLCSELTGADCQTQQGIYLGDGTTCTPNPCEQPPMACCFPDGHCEFVTAEICGQMGGVSQGFGTVCDPNPCPPPTMACCFLDGHCELLTVDGCTQAGGTSQGLGTNCDPNLCNQPPATGACCLDDQGNCQVLTQAQCTDANGQYQGDNTTCEPTNPCPIVPTKGTTWGQIKADYR